MLGAVSNVQLMGEFRESSFNGTIERETNPQWAEEPLGSSKGWGLRVDVSLPRKEREK